MEMRILFDTEENENITLSKFKLRLPSLGHCIVRHSSPSSPQYLTYLSMPAVPAIGQSPSYYYAPAKFVKINYGVKKRGSH